MTQRMFQRILACSLGVLLFCMIRSAATAGPDTQPAAPTSVPVNSQPLRDPTQADPALRQALEGGQGAASPIARSLPQITRRGLVIAANQPPEALIEVLGAGTYFIHKGSSVAINLKGVSMTLNVKSLSADGIEISIDPQNVTMTLR